MEDSSSSGSDGEGEQHDPFFISETLCETLTKEPSMRDDMEMLIAEHYIQKFRFFNQFTPEVRQKLAYCMRLSDIEAGTHLIEQGEESDNGFFFLVRGSCDVLVREETHNKVRGLGYCACRGPLRRDPPPHPFTNYPPTTDPPTCRSPSCPLLVPCTFAVPRLHHISLPQCVAVLQPGDT